MSPCQTPKRGCSFLTGGATAGIAAGRCVGVCFARSPGTQSVRPRRCLPGRCTWTGTLATSGSTRPCLGRRLNLTAPLDRPYRRLTLREQESVHRRQAPRRGDRMAAFVFRLENADGAPADRRGSRALFRTGDRATRSHPDQDAARPRRPRRRPGRAAGPGRRGLGRMRDLVAAGGKVQSCPRRPEPS